MKVEIEPKSTTKTIIISKKKIHATAKSETLCEASKISDSEKTSSQSEILTLRRKFVSIPQDISVPAEKLVFKKPSVSETDKAETAQNAPVPSEKLIFKKSSVLMSDKPELSQKLSETEIIIDSVTASDTAPVVPKKRKLKFKNSVQVLLFALCTGSACGLAFSINFSKNGLTAKSNSLDTELTTTEAVSETETASEEATAEPTTETTTVPAETNVTPFIDYDMDIDPDKPMIALTYDDGPAVGSTEKIVKILKKNHAHATFFLVGDNITEETEKILQEEVEAGCEIGNHTLSHQNLEKLDTDAGMSQLKKCDDKIYRCIQRKANLVRPPYGAYDNEIREADKRMFIYWSLDTSDWKLKDADKIYDVVMEYISDGDIVLLHDIHEETAEASERLIPDLIEMGYQLVTVSELVHYRNFASEDGMVLFNVHPDMPLYNSLYGTVCEHEDLIQTSCYEEESHTMKTETESDIDADTEQTTTEETVA